jgi:hypothetical protein
MPAPRPSTSSVRSTAYTRPSDMPEQLYALWDGAVEGSRARLEAALADGGLDQLVHAPSDGRRDSRRRLLRDACDQGRFDPLRIVTDAITYYPERLMKSSVSGARDCAQSSSTTRRIRLPGTPRQDSAT